MFVIGILTKVVDLIEDDSLKLFRYANLLFGASYGVLIGYAIVNYLTVSPLLLGTVLAMIIYGRIDAWGHYVGIAALILFLVTAWPWSTQILLLGLFIAVNLFEEFLNDLLDRGHIKQIILRKIISVRPLLEGTALVVAVVTRQPEIFLGIFFYDIGYISTGRLGLKFLRHKKN
jgi:hypothetical protein